jgi:FtsH-binding integral membrane protein
MKTFNLMALSLAFAILGALGLCALFEFLLGPDQAKFVVMPFALALGFSARRIMQKLLGYTMEEAIKMDNESNESK